MKRFIPSLFLGMAVVLPAAAEVRAPAGAPSAEQAQKLVFDGTSMRSETAPKKKAPKRKRVAKRVAPKVRKPASLDMPAQVFDIAANFESMLDDQAKLARNPAAFTAMARVIGVRRDLGLTEADAIKASRDIVLNGGTGAGLSEGMVLAVVRKIPVIDPYQANAQSELEVEFAKVKIVHAQADVAIARLESIEAIDFGMSVGTRAILVGDFVTQSRK